MFKSAWDAALPVYVIGTALIFLFGSLLKTDERRSSVTLWDRFAQSQTPQKSHLPGRSRWRRTPFASVLIRTACPVGKPNRPSSLIRCHGSFWAVRGQAAFRSTSAQNGTSAGYPIADVWRALRLALKYAFHSFSWHACPRSLGCAGLWAALFYSRYI